MRSEEASSRKQTIKGIKWQLKKQNMITFWQTIISLIFLYVVCIAFHLVKLIVFKNRHSKSLWPGNREKPVRALIILGSGPLPVVELPVLTADLFLCILGGHTGEMVRLLSTLDFRRFSPRLYLVARTDDTSAKRVQHLECSQVSSTADSNVSMHMKNFVSQLFLQSFFLVSDYCHFQE